MLADELFSIADDSTNDFMEIEDKKGKTRIVPDNEAQARSRLRVDTRKWYLSKVLPKIYGDKVQTELSGRLAIGEVTDPKELTDEQLRDEILARRRNPDSNT